MSGRNRRAIVLLSVSAVTGAAFAASTPPRGVVPADVLTYPSIAGLAVSPDGTQVVYVVEKSSPSGDGYVHQMFLLATDGKSPARSLSRADAFDDAPEFSPNGRYLAFLADDGRGTQLRVLRLGSKTSRVVTHFESGVGEFAWAPDSSRFAVSAFAGAAIHKARERGWRARHRREAGSRKPVEPRDYDESAPIVVDRSVPRRDGEGWLDHQHSQLWIVGRDGGIPRAVTDDGFDNVEPSWSPDGTWIAFTSNREPDPDLSDNTDIFLVRPDSRDLRRFAGGPGPDSEPTWSRHGDRLAWLSSPLPNDYYLNARLVVAALAGGDPVDLTTGMSVGLAEDWVQVSSSRARPIWSGDDATLYAPFERRGTSYLAALSSTHAGEPVREISQGPSTLDFVRYNAGEHAGFVFARGDASHPSEVFALAEPRVESLAQPRRLTSVHAKWLAGRVLSQPSRLLAKSRDGEPVESWLYPPLGVESGKRYPLIVYLHGGPEAFDGEYFDEGLENQIFPGAGFGVLRVNYRGSTSYGEAFSAAIRGDWHRREHDDIMAALDVAQLQPWVDNARLGIGGWSYGGIQTVWVLGHTDRFKAAAPERFEVDYLSAFGEDHWLAQYLAELGDPSAHEDLYRRLSPITYVQSIRTPLLLIAGEDDLNCPLPQALQLYARLKARQAPVELVVYPGESHTFARPDHLRNRLERLVRWFDSRLR
ncbi:MAG: S9 family peptidase [Acidobacteriota bacterium]